MPLKPYKMQHGLVKQANRLSKEWESSAQREDLVNTINDLILLQDGLSIDSAVCLGLGSMALADLRPLDSWEAASSLEDGREPEKLRSVGGGGKRNACIYQLLVFETALMSLRKKFTIGSVRFQDPSFTDADRQFLQQRGHTVVDWNPYLPKVTGRQDMDPSLLEFVTGSTMCYLPFLDYTTTVEVICSFKPSLYLGLNLVASTVNRYLYSCKQSKDLMDRYSDIVLSSDFKSIKAFDGKEPDDFGFMWPANVKDCQETADRLLKRNERIINAEMDVMTDLHQRIAAMKLDEKCSKPESS